MSHPSVALKVSVMYLHIPSALAVGSLIHVASVYTLIFIINMLLILCNVSCCHVYPTIYTPLHLSSFPSSSFHPFSFLLFLSYPSRPMPPSFLGIANDAPVFARSLGHHATLKGPTPYLLSYPTKAEISVSFCFPLRCHFCFSLFWSILPRCKLFGFHSRFTSISPYLTFISCFKT
jgi:hypothetical protein